MAGPATSFENALAIANPTAGGGRVARRWDELVAALSAAIGGIRVRRTEGTGHATQIAREAVWAGVDTLISVGGDGTHGEVVAGVVRDRPEPGRIQVGVVPVGTGGDFRRMLVGNADPIAHIRALTSREAHEIDVGLLTWRRDGAERERVFLNECSVGMSAEVCARVNASGKRFGGRVAYFVASVDALREWGHAEVRVTVDGQVVGDWSTATVMIANGQFAGGGMRFAPAARLADGMLDVTVIPRRPNSAMILGTATRLYLGNIDRGSAAASAFRGHRIGIELLRPGPAPVEADGEPLGKLPVTATVIPGAIRMIGVRPEVL